MVAKTDAEKFFVGDATADAANNMDDTNNKLPPPSIVDGPMPPPIPDGVTVQSVEVAGVIHDAAGNTWTIPEKDETDFRYKSKFIIPRPDPLMGYQFIRKEELNEYMGEQWVPCTREEIGVAGFKAEGDEYGSPLDRYHVVGTQICVKKPKVLIDREYAAQKRVCDAAVSATQPPPARAEDAEIDPDTGKPTGRTMDQVRASAGKSQKNYNLDRKVVKVNPKNVDNERVAATE